VEHDDDDLATQDRLPHFCVQKTYFGVLKISWWPRKGFNPSYYHKSWHGGAQRNTYTGDIYLGWVSDLSPRQGPGKAHSMVDKTRLAFIYTSLERSATRTPAISHKSVLAFARACENTATVTASSHGEISHGQSSVSKSKLPY
jgi:hypothetical protein